MRVRDSEFIERLVENSPDGLIAMSPEGEILFWNQGAERLFGYSVEEATGRYLIDLMVPTHHLNEEQEALQETLRNGSVTYETVRQRKDGLYINVMTSMKLVSDKGVPLRFIAVNQKDITS